MIGDLINECLWHALWKGVLFSMLSVDPFISAGLFFHYQSTLKRNTEATKYMLEHIT